MANRPDSELYREISSIIRKHLDLVDSVPASGRLDAAVNDAAEEIYNRVGRISIVVGFMDLATLTEEERGLLVAALQKAGPDG